MQAVTEVPLQARVVSIEQELKNYCQDCSHKNTCFSRELNDEEIEAFNAIVRHSKKLQRGDYLYRAGDKFKSIYTIRSGSLKTFLIDEDGQEQILGFSIQGDVLALDGATLSTYPTTAQALETTYVCEIPFARYMELAAQIPSLYEQLLTQMSHQIRYEEKHTLMCTPSSTTPTLVANIGKPCT